MSKKKIHNLFLHATDVDVSENDIWDYSPEVLQQLLLDHTMSAKVRKEAGDHSLSANIFWATNDYASRGEGYQYDDQIRPECITGDSGRVVMPRVLKDRQLQIDRTKGKAEVFTPSWVCNAQNNLVDEAWFGRKDVFNFEGVDENGTHHWISTNHVDFPENTPGKTWVDYVKEDRLEITCGEAPYLVSRYDTTTGEPIPLEQRIGILDRKLRVINENIPEGDTKAWLDMAKIAFQHTYGYEWQGDNLLLAREAMLFTFIEYFLDRFNKRDDEGKLIIETVPRLSSIVGIARTISWNLWQMDGLKMVVPDSCDHVHARSVFGDTVKVECPACKKGLTLGHIGVPCLIRDWSKKKAPKDWKPGEGEDPHSKPWQKITFASLMSKNNESQNKS